jgi:hypothetical protein
MPWLAPDVEFAPAQEFTAALAVEAPARPHLNPIRVAHARVHRDPPAIVIAHTADQRPPDTLWSRLGRWFTQHEARKVWSPSGGEGAG